MITQTKRTTRTLLALTLAVMASLTFHLAAEEIVGEWDMKWETDDDSRLATLTFSKSADGALTGEWGSNKLSEVTFRDGKLTFVQTRRRRDREFTQKYEGTLKDGKLEGVLSSDRGESKMSGTRFEPKLAVLGHWDLRFRIQDRDLNARLSVSDKKDGVLHAEWSQDVGEHKITRVRFADSTLTLDRTVTLGDRELDVTNVAKIDGDTLTGTMISEYGEIEANGTRHGAELIGVWEISSTSDRGPRTRLMRVFSDLTARYETYGREIPVTLQLKDDQVSFVTELRFGDRAFELNLNGKLAGNKLDGEIVTSRGGTPFTGKKRTSGSAAIGTWEFTRETDNGVRTSTLKITDARSGTYSFRDNEIALENLSIDGSEVAFKVTLKFNEREIPLSFKGAVKEDTLEGQWTTPRGTRDSVGKRKKAN